MSEIEVVVRSNLHTRSDRLFYRISVDLTHMATDQQLARPCVAGSIF